MAPFADLNTTWFALIGLLWAGYLFLEGFDFGVAIIAPFVASDETERRLCLNSVGPVWDGNEVWLLTAGGATFAAFPLWYARLFNGFYLALFLILLALIARGVSFEFRGKHPSPVWRKTWDWANFFGSLIPAIVWGAAFINLVHGVPLSSQGQYFGGLLGLLHPIALAGGLASLAIFALHGSVFLSLKTTGELAARARRAAVSTGVAATALLAVTVAWVAGASHPAVAGSVQRRLAAHLGDPCRSRRGPGHRVWWPEGGKAGRSYRPGRPFWPVWVLSSPGCSLRCSPPATGLPTRSLSGRPPPSTTP